MNSLNFQELITCSTCLAAFNENLNCPRVLACGHSFCHSCLEKVLAQSPSCPTCKANINFLKAESIPTNFSLKNLIDVSLEINDTSKQGKITASSSKLLSQGHCSIHDNYKGIRCMDCEIYICGMCATLQHKPCTTLVIEEAYKELKKRASKKVEKELRERMAISNRFSASVGVLNEKIKSINEEIKRKELEIKDCEKRIEELESLKSKENVYCDKLRQLIEMVKKSSSNTEYSNELDNLLEEGKSKILNFPPHLYLPQTREELGILCQNGTVFAVEDRYEGAAIYGKVAMKDKDIYVYNFQPEKPEACILNFKEFLYQFSVTTKLPKTAFLQLKNKKIGSIDVVIKTIDTVGDYSRANNFILLCSNLKGSTYKGLILKRTGDLYYAIAKGPSPVVELTSEINCETKVMRAGVYGMSKDNSYFIIQMIKERDTFPQFGEVIVGFKTLRVQRTATDLPIEECGLVI